MTIYYAPSTSGFYSSEIHSVIPEDAIKITQDEHAALLESQAAGLKIQAGPDGKPYAVDPKSIMPVAQLKTAKLAELSSAFSSAMKSIKSGYPEEEIQSWSKQEGEARGYTAGTVKNPPLLTAMSTARGILVDDLAARVIANADAWTAISGALIGKRQAYEDQVNAAKTVSDVGDIVWSD